MLANGWMKYLGFLDVIKYTGIPSLAVRADKRDVSLSKKMALHIVAR